MAGTELMTGMIGLSVGMRVNLFLVNQEMFSPPVVCA
jgi:hypothetical protein